MPENKVNVGMTRECKLSNKFAYGDQVWAVVALGPELKVGKYPVLAMNAEFLGQEWVYMYHLPVAADGHADGINNTIVREDMAFFTREEAEARAHECVKDIQKEYDKEIERVSKEYEDQMEESKKRFERTISKLHEEKDRCNADDLVIQPREVVVEAETQAAEEVSQAEPEKKEECEICGQVECICPKEVGEPPCGTNEMVEVCPRHGEDCPKTKSNE